MKVEFLEARPGHDSRDVLLDGKFIGFAALDSDEINLMKCFKCRRENYYSAVPHGCCAWCGWDVKEASK